MKVPGVETLREALAALKVDTRGHKSTLKKRLRAAEKRQQEDQHPSIVNDRGKAVAKPLPTRPEGQDFDSYLLLDFEATCQRWEPKHGEFFGFPNEIIEFPVVLLRWQRKFEGNARSASPASSSESLGTTDSDSSSAFAPHPITKHDSGTAVSDQEDDYTWELAPVAEFRRFVRPTWRPRLTNFCKELTGISQVRLTEAQDDLHLNAGTCTGGCRSLRHLCRCTGGAVHILPPYQRSL